MELYQYVLKNKIGEDCYNKLEMEAEKEVALAMQIPLIDKYRSEKYYQQRNIIGELIDELYLFEDLEIRTSPVDVVNVFFRCKVLYASQTEKEYGQRIGSESYVDEFRFACKWSERSEDIDIVIDRYLRRLESQQKDRILVTQIDYYNSGHGGYDLQNFFEELLKEIQPSYLTYFNDSHLLELFKKAEPYLKEYSIEDAKKYFNAPSIGFRSFGSEVYCRFYASAWLRTFLDLFRIAGFIHHGQMDFGGNKAEMMAPTSPIFLSSGYLSCYCWEEDKKEPWAKNPDGSLFLSFGYRGLAKMWLDQRTCPAIREFILANKIIFNQLKNPWDNNFIYSVCPSLNILSSATQIPDLGAKILLIYCCLEHMFVPNGKTSNNKTYIIGGINAIQPDLLPWFDRLYKARCDYAHKGFVLNDGKIIGLVVESIGNVLTLLNSKLSISL